MFPFIRLANTYRLCRKEGPMDFLGTHVSEHICWPWDLDLFLELNNGRTLMLYDLGRMSLGFRSGLFKVLQEQKWSMTVAGSCIRYRRRVRGFDRFTMRSRLTTWDDRFLYMEQSMWRKGECTSHVLIRMAITDQNGLVPTARAFAALPDPQERPPMPDWIAAWAKAENQRPWPPMQEENAPALAS